MIQKRYILILSVLGCNWLSGCCGIPPNTPLLLEKTSERIETRSIVVSKTLRTVLDEASFTKADIQEARTALEGIDKSQLTSKDQTILQDVIKGLGQAERALDFSGKYSSVPKETERIFGECVISLKLVQQIVNTEVDKKELVQDMINIIEKPKGENE